LAICTGALPIISTLITEGGLNFEPGFEHRLANHDTIIHQLCSSEEYCHLLGPCLDALQESVKLEDELDATGQTALHVAASKDIAGAVDYIVRSPLCTRNLLEKLVDKGPKQGHDALYLAISCFASNSVALLLEAYASIDLAITDTHCQALLAARDCDGNSLLHAFARSGLDLAIDHLFHYVPSFPVDLPCDQCNAFVDDGSPIHAAIRTDQAESVHALVRHSANVNSTDNFHARTPMHTACHIGAVRCVELLVTLPDVDLTIRSRSGESILHAAEDGGDDEIIQLVRKALHLPVDQSVYDSDASSASSVAPGTGLIISFDDL
jgi:ankyrin repeat protein